MLIFAVLYWIFQIFSNRYSTLAELELIHDNPGMSPTDEHWHPYISGRIFFFVVLLDVLSVEFPQLKCEDFSKLREHSKHFADW
mmetsp:Transcript_64422/g.172494  ORF Transcript_64422/g.172494 Transcript_64422/m.172494 type:complete len:84 (-) Transcript_64422:1382-1633(-)